ncbi:hypothetical protein DYQ93_11400 [Xanthomonas sp. LMG 8992]|uniref:phage portal protein family protein n=1 Tax=Xanthomonas sp. LMG 8992 TaxID=1591157 RepID=UPI00136C5225|nr:minor capsid protein [Xanthomonas sp. LMG 8992]MXV11625.1 hypothetical protein [Xanthomonas sp. LMG 8992]
MNLNPFRRRKSADATRNQRGSVAAATRDAHGLGAWSGILGQWEPRAVSPWLYEALKEAVPMLDAGISRLATLDGIIQVQGDNDKLVAEIEDWMANVPVNDLENGFQAAYASQSEELYEQGLGVVEFVYSPDGRDVVGLRVADSKGIGFVRDSDRMRVFYRAPRVDGDRRADGMGNVESILRRAVRSSDPVSTLTGVGYTELDPAQLMISVHRPEADNPYGTSVLRSVPFVVQILLRMQNATGRVWERFGDPSFHVQYSTKNRKITSGDAQKRAEQITAALGQALTAKASGNSVDLSTGTGADDEININVIGAVGEALEIEMPAKHMLEQIVAALEVPAWMLGVSWAQATGIGEPQSELVLQSSKTRFARRESSLRRPIEAMLRARGRTWKRGDWALVQQLPNLRDELKRAQANFLNRQAEMMGSGGADPAASPRGVDNNLRAARASQRKGADDPEGEPWAESDPALHALERRTIEGMGATWSAHAGRVMELLGLAQPGTEPYRFDLQQLPQMLYLGDRASATLGAQLLSASVDAWDRGVANAAEDVGGGKHARKAPVALEDDPELVDAIARMRESIRAQLRSSGLAKVSDGIVRVYRERIVAALTAGEFDGQNPVNVARELSERFDAGDYNWERLARSEIGEAQAVGKMDLYAQQGVEWYDYETAGDGKVSRICRELEAAGPYRVGDPASPIPVRDSHPNCRCTARARA